MIWPLPIWLADGRFLRILFAQEGPSPTPTAPETDVSARSKALELAGAFSNDGYKIRDGYWPGEIEPNRPQFLEVNLFSGNEYWFSAAVILPDERSPWGCSTRWASRWTSRLTRTAKSLRPAWFRKSADATM